ncbi:MarR family winged helix-turn-helix transcriptional regulator, partial [Chloroflexota bacterium]
KYIKMNNQQYDFWFLLNRGRDLSNLVTDEYLRKYGISQVEFATLFCISLLGDDVAPADLARQLFRNRNTISYILKRLEKRGLVTLRKNMEKKNQIKVTNTEKAKEILRFMEKNELLKRIIDSFSEEERQLFRKFMQKMYDMAVIELREDRYYSSRLPKLDEIIVVKDESSNPVT